LQPKLETFARGLPFAIRNLNLPDQSRVLVQTTGVVNCCWTLYRDAGTWSLWQGKHPELTSSVTIPAEVAWRVWTKSMDRGEASRQIQAVGDGSVVDPIVSFVAIMA
jgi:hypothetical protein